MDKHPPGMLLGRSAPSPQVYAPQVLYPIARSEGRRELSLPTPLPFSGSDLWHAYEMSWLDNSGKPVARVGRFHFPVTAPNMVESKSFKLYLNSLNGSVFASEEALGAVLRNDLSAVTGAEVEVELLGADAPELAGASLTGLCLDDCPAVLPEGGPDPSLLGYGDGPMVEETLYTHLLRSLCPVTGQPDWATLWLSYRGRPLEQGSLLTYLLAYRNHQEFHEQCVERIFCDLYAGGDCEALQVQGFYTRRGGLDINPFRSTDPEARPQPRLNRQ